MRGRGAGGRRGTGRRRAEADGASVGGGGRGAGGLTAGRACTFIGGSPLAKPLKWRPDDLRKLGQ